MAGPGMAYDAISGLRHELFAGAGLDWSGATCCEVVWT